MDLFAGLAIPSLEGAFAFCLVGIFYFARRWLSPPRLFVFFFFFFFFFVFFFRVRGF